MSHKENLVILYMNLQGTSGAKSCFMSFGWKYKNGKNYGSGYHWDFIALFGSSFMEYVLKDSKNYRIEDCRNIQSKLVWEIVEFYLCF